MSNERSTNCSTEVGMETSLMCSQPAEHNTSGLTSAMEAKLSPHTHTAVCSACCVSGNVDNQSSLASMETQPYHASQVRGLSRAPDIHHV